MPATEPPRSPAPPVLVVIGASVRAWAWSARRAGWHVRGADLFADRDLLAIADAIAVPPEDYPEGLATAADRFPPGPWCYSGALENAPDLVDALAARRPLAGCPGSVLRQVRSPRLLGRALAAAGLAFPATRDAHHGLPEDGTWLVKPRRGAAGRGIAPWHGPRAGAATESPRVWQERVPGVPVSASFILDAGGARLVGTTEQLVGLAAWHAAPFGWCGAVEIEPGRLVDRWREQWTRVGRVLHEDFGLVGAVGVDAVAAGTGRLVVLEVNPRPTASMELVDRRTGGSLALEHLVACGLAGGRPPAAAPAGGTQAKGVLRARRPITVDARATATLDDLARRFHDGDDRPGLADLPRTGTTIPAGSPLLSLFAAGDGPEDARRRLARRVALVEAALAGAPPGG